MTGERLRIAGLDLRLGPVFPVGRSAFGRTAYMGAYAVWREVEGDVTVRLEMLNMSSGSWDIAGACLEPDPYGPPGHYTPVFVGASLDAVRAAAAAFVASPLWTRLREPCDEPYLAYSGWLNEHGLEVDRCGEAGQWIIRTLPDGARMWQAVDFSACLSLVARDLGVAVPEPRGTPRRP